VSPVKYELGFHIPEDAILHSHRREKFKSYIDNCSFLQNEHSAIVQRIMQNKPAGDMNAG
jgi:hypothetical protein